MASQIQQAVEKLPILLGACCSDAQPFSGQKQRRDKNTDCFELKGP